MRWAEHVECIGQRGVAHRGLVETPEGKRLPERSTRRREDNINMDLQEVGWMAWTVLMWFRIGIGGGLL
jgi:hypothetical protein